MPKISELNVTANVATSDLLVVVKDPSGAPSTNKITAGNFMTYASRFMPYANTTAVGGIKVGENLTINATGYLNGLASNANLGSFVFNDTTISTSIPDGDIYITPLENGYVHLSKVVFQEFDVGEVGIWYRDANTVGNYAGIGNSSIYLDIASVINEAGNFVLKADGRFKYFTNDEVAVQNTIYGHIILKTENNDKFIKLHNVTDNTGIEIRTDNHDIILAPNNYVWEFTPQGNLIFPDGSTQNTSFNFTANTSNWNGSPPTTISQAIDRLAILVKSLNSGTGA